MRSDSTATRRNRALKSRGFNASSRLIAVVQQGRWPQARSSLPRSSHSRLRLRREARSSNEAARFSTAVERPRGCRVFRGAGAGAWADLSYRLLGPLPRGMPPQVAFFEGRRAIPRPPPGGRAWRQTRRGIRLIIGRGGGPPWFDVILALPPALGQVAAVLAKRALDTPAADRSIEIECPCVRVWISRVSRSPVREPRDCTIECSPVLPGSDVVAVAPDHRRRRRQ